MYKLLVIDDKIENIVLIKEMLKLYLPEIQIYGETSGEAGVERALSLLPDVIISDISMQGIDGFETCKLLRSNIITANIPIILQTAQYHDSSFKVKGLESGADVFVSKPVNEAELVANIKVMLRIKQTQDDLHNKNQILDNILLNKKEEVVKMRLKIAVIEETYKGQFRNSKAAMLLINPKNGHVLQANRAAQKLYGIKLNEFKNKPISTLINAENSSEIIEQLHLAARRDKHRLIIKRKLPNSEVRIIELQCAPIKYKGKTIIYAISQDVTQHRQTIKALKKSEKQFKNLLEFVSDAIFLHTENGNFIQVNKAACNLLNYSKEELLQLSPNDIIIPEKIAERKNRVNELQQKNNLVFESTLVRKDGTHCDVEISSIILDTDDKPHILSIARNITERKRTEYLVQQQYKLHEKILSNLNEAVIILQPKTGLIQSYNQTTNEIFAYSADELVNKNISILHVNKQMQDNFDEDCLAGIELKGRFECEFLMKRKTGEIFHSENILTYIFNPDKDQEKQILVIRDISDRKKIEQKLRDAKEKAEESDRLKTSFLSNMSHELRTPMNAIIGFSSLLSNSELTKDQRDEYINYININSESLLNLVNDLLDISKIETGMLEIKESTCNLNRLMNDILITLNERKRQEPEKDVEIKLNLPNQETNMLIITDHNRLRQILFNLVGNGFKFTEKGNVEFGYMFKSPQLLQFYIKDTGIGIKPNKVVQIFDRFRKVLDNNDRLYAGTGLGLSISKSLVELMGGKIWAESTPGVGSIFYFTLPIRIVENMETTVTETNTEKQFVWEGKTIIIAEDEDINYYLMEEALQETKVTILRAENGQIVLDLLKEQPKVDIILMDIKMPVMDGIEATQFIKKQFKTLPIIAQTAYAMEEEKKLIFDAGCDDYISKPLKIKDLFKKIEKWLKQNN